MTLRLPIVPIVLCATVGLFGATNASASGPNPRPLVDKADAALQALLGGLSKPGPLDEALWQSFDEAVAGVATIRPDAPAAYRHASFPAHIRQARTSADPATALAAVFGGASLVTQTTITQTAAKLTFTVPADTCFVMVSNAHPETTSSTIEGVQWNKDFAAVHRFKSDAHGAFEGACVSREVAMVYDVTTKGAASKVGADWFVFSWPRASFPVEIAAKVSLSMDHRCSPDWFFNVHTDGVPGMLNWEGDAPRLTIEVFRTNALEVRTINGVKSRAEPSKLSAMWPKTPQVAISKFGEFCTKDSRSPDPLVAKAQACHESVDKKYLANLKAAREKAAAAKVKENRAKPAGWAAARRAWQAAENAWQNLATKEKNERETKCLPLDMKYQAAKDVVAPKLKDWFIAQTKSPWSLDVPAFLLMATEARMR